MIRHGLSSQWRASRSFGRRLAATAVVLLVGAGLAQLDHPALAATGAVLPGYNATALGASDDGSYPCASSDSGTPPGCSPSAVPVGFPLDFYGTTYTHVYVNNNGNLTFNGPLSTYTPFGLPGTHSVIIAPFFADVDTRVGNQASFGVGNVGGRPSFGVTWPGVGCFNGIDNVTDTFQVVLIDRSDIAPGDFDIEFNYDSIQWDAGQASGGTSSCQSQVDSDAAAVGYSNGSGQPGSSYQVPGSQTSGALLDSSASGLIHQSLNPDADGQGSGALGRYIFEVRGGQPVNPLTVSGTLSGGGRTGSSIGVGPGTAVTDQAAIHWAQPGATGMVAYTVYSDAACTKKVADAGKVTVANGIVPPSNPLTLNPPGDYYWQASYSGDGVNGPAASPCGSNVEDVRVPTTLSATPEVLQLSGPTLELFGLTATLHSATAPLAKQPVDFYAGTTALCSAVTDSTGKASCNAALNVAGVLASVLADGYVAVFPGSTEYAPSSATASLIG